MQNEELKEFDFKKCQELNKKFKDFYFKNRIFVNVESQTGETRIDKKSSSKPDSISKFKIVQSEAKKPIYAYINGRSDIGKISNDIESMISKAIEDIANLLDQYESKLNKETIEKIDMHLRNIQRFQKAFLTKSKSLDFEDCVKVDEICEKYYEFLSKMVRELFIERLIDPIYQSIKDKNSDIFLFVLKIINEFLEKLGIYTCDIEVGSKIDFDYCEVIPDDNSETDDYKLKEVIKEIKCYPYVFDEKHIVISGKVIVWRFNK